MKIKKIMAMLLAATMIMGSTITTFAAPGEIPTESDVETVKVSNVDPGAKVKAYQIVDGVYNTSGFVRYEAVKGVNVADPVSPTSSEVAAIAKEINAGKIKLTSVDMTDKSGVYEAQLNPGYWVVLVRGENGSAKIYNPMLVSVWYSKSGSDNTRLPGNVDANTDWTLTTKDAWAKSSEVKLTKTAKDSADFGESVEYKIETTIPGYGPEYENPVFEIKDQLSSGDLKLTDGQITVKANDAVVETEKYEITGNTANSTEFTVKFNSSWIKDNINAKIEIAYNATVTANKVNKESHDNTATLTYSNNPATTDTKTDTEKVYSFDIGGAATGTNGLITKVGEDQDSTALPGAEFTLYTDAECTNRYINEVHTAADRATATSDEDGNIHITGLEAGTEGTPVTYYLKETYAPNPYTLNDTVFKIDITANIENEELKSWNIDITDTATSEKVMNNFTINNEGEVTRNGEGIEIQNTKLSSLPSTGGIGTTIFTIGGCAIMVAAAALFFASRRKANK